MNLKNIELPDAKIAELCRKYHVTELAVFGSSLRRDFDEASDIDFLVEYEPDAPVSLIEHCALENALARLLDRPVDLVSKAGLKWLIRDQVLAGARTVYEAA